MVNNIKVIRESKGISQADFANAIGVTQGTVSAWEIGFWTPTFKNLQKIAKYFSVSVSDLYVDDTMSDLQAEEDAEMQALGLSGDDDTEMINPEECF